MSAGTPSQSIGLGADLLEQLGDLKGAAKTLSEEAKNAQKEVKQAKFELKEVEIQQKKNEAEAARIRGGLGKMSSTEREKAEREIASLIDSNRVQKSFEKVIKSEAVVADKRERAADLRTQDKAKKRLDKEFQDTLNSFQKTTQVQLFGVKDKLDTVAKSLLDERGSSVTKMAGGALQALSGLVDKDMIKGIVSRVGTAGHVVAVGGSAAAGAAVGAKFVAVQHAFRDRGVAVSQSQAARAEEMRREVSNLVTQNLSGGFLESFNRENAERSGKASAEVAKRHIIGFDIGAIIRDKIPGFSKVFAGASARELERERLEVALQSEDLRKMVVSETFGKEFVDRFSIDKLMKSKSAETAWQNYLETDGYKRLYAGISDTAAGKEEFIREFATNQQKGTFAAEATRRSEEVRQANIDPVAVAERHNRATRFAGMEQQRQRRFMQPTRF